MKNKPQDKYRLGKPKDHLKFIRRLPCCHCDAINPEAFQFEGDYKLSLPLCKQYLEGRAAGYYNFKDEAGARELARKLYLLSGDGYSSIMVLCGTKGKYI